MNWRDLSPQCAPTQYARLTVNRVGIVVHATAGIASLAWLQRDEPIPSKKSSADFLIDRGGNIIRVIPAGNYAFHSGMARWQGYQERDGSINRGFYGVELENLENGIEQFTNYQYIGLAALVRYILTLRSISTRMICTHHECAIPAGRKSDPLLLDWNVVTREMLSPSPNSPELGGLAL